MAIGFKIEIEKSGKKKFLNQHWLVKLRGRRLNHTATIVIELLRINLLKKERKFEFSIALMIVIFLTISQIHEYTDTCGLVFKL